MYNIEWKRLHQKYGAQYNRHSNFIIDPGKRETKLTFVSGKLKDKIVTLIGFDYDKAIVELPDGTEERFPYGRLYSMNIYGEVNNGGPRDMVGQHFEEDAWVAYARRNGKTGYVFCMGRVVEVTKGGSLNVKEVLVDGVKPERHRYDDGIVTVKQIKALKLPVDPNRLTLAIFSGFTSADGSHD